MLLLARTVNPFWLSVKALILLALYDQSTLICHFKAPFLVEYKVGSWVEYKVDSKKSLFLEISCCCYGTSAVVITALDF